MKAYAAFGDWGRDQSPAQRKPIDAFAARHRG
jgi:hypothetical protein